MSKLVLFKDLPYYTLALTKSGRLVMKIKEESEWWVLDIGSDIHWRRSLRVASRMKAVPILDLVKTRAELAAMSPEDFFD